MASLLPAPPTTHSVGYEFHYGAGALFTALVVMDRNNYFVFDLSSVTAPIVSAKLLLPAGKLESDDIEMFYVVAPAAPGTALAEAALLKSAHGVGPTAF